MDGSGKSFIPWESSPALLPVVDAQHRNAEYKISADGGQAFNVRQSPTGPLADREGGTGGCVTFVAAACCKPS